MQFVIALNVCNKFVTVIESGHTISMFLNVQPQIGCYNT